CRAYHQQYGVNFVTGIAADSFGPGDNFSLEDSHVIPALIHKMHEAKIHGAESVALWGTGRPRRDFIFASDLADACIFVMREYDQPQPINLSSGTDMSIGEVALLIQEVVGYRGALVFDTSKPDGMPLKALDSTKLTSMGWKPQTSLLSALTTTYEWFLQE